MDALRRDLAYALRRSVRTPGFTAVAVLSLALGIGANTAMFSVIHAVLLRDPPFADPDGLVEVYLSEASGMPYSTFSVPDFEDLREASAGIFAAVRTFSQRLAEVHPETNRDRTMSLVPSKQVALHPMVDRALVPVAGLLLAVVGLVLLLACANLAGFLLARAEARRREIAVRLSLGAGRGALVRQLLAESLLLATAGGITGLLVARVVVDALVGLRPPIPIPLSLDVPLEGPVFLFTAAVSTLAGVALGLVPALQATRPDLASTLRTEGSAVTGGSRLRSGLVVAQVALSLLLLVGSGLFLRSLKAAGTVDPGFYTGPAGLLSPQLELSGMSPEEGRAFTTELVSRLEARPEVDGVALTDVLPLGFGVQLTELQVPGVPSEAPNGLHSVDFAWVSGRYFDVMEVPLLEGRGFGPEDLEGSPRVAVVSRAFAARFFSGGEAVGRRLEDRHGTPIEIVGVARDTKVRTLGEAPRPRIYFAESQRYLEGIQVIVRGPGPSADLLHLARRTALDLHPRLVLFDARTMEEHLAVHLFPPRMAALLLSAFGGLGLLLATVGIYGLVSHTVARRTREVGIRLSLGATPASVVRLAVGGGMRLVAAGVGLGAILAAGASVLVARFLYGIEGLDPVTLLGIPPILVAVAWLPARRAARVDPVQALRAE